MKKTLCMFLFFLFGQLAFAQTDIHCRIMGNIFITEVRSQAEFTFYLEESEAFADLLVFPVDSRVFADRAGLWHIVDSPALADFILFKEKERGYAHFKMYYTETESFAGCQSP